MKKRFLALLFALSLSVCMCVSAFATDTGIDIIDDPLSYYFQNQLLGVQKGTGVTLVCPNGDYKTLYTGGTLVTCPYDGEALVLADAGGVTANKAPSGIGRKDLPGYADDNGTPNYNLNGVLQVVVNPIGFHWDNSSYKGAKFGSSLPVSVDVSGSQMSSPSNPKWALYAIYEFVAPCDGFFYLGREGSGQKVFTSSLFYNSRWYTQNYNIPNYSGYGLSVSASKGQTLYYVSDALVCSVDGYQQWGAIKAEAYPLVVLCEPLSSLAKQTSVTINNNTWNGNIYTDNSTNLTYIYPQYTTINEKNETVTNISTNPIIYNNETKQYYTYDTVTNNYYYITYEEPKPSATPAPTWTPGGGATRGGGVGRHPSDTDAADWTLHYYILNNRRYDAYYALKKTEVDTETKLPWVDNKKYISTTQIPIANGQYTVSVPDGVYWRVWSWDEASQTLTGVNSSNWHSTINNFLFNATGEYIFEFCKADGSDFDTAKDVTLKLKNDKITDYEDGGTIVEEPTPSPSPEPMETPSPTDPPIPTTPPTPGGGTVPTPGGSGSTSTPETGSSGSGSGWNPFKWLTDLLKDLIEDILKGLWKLLTSIFGFILWLVSLLFKLFPWMPNSGILALCAGVVVVTVIRIIKFITGR